MTAAAAAQSSTIVTNGEPPATFVASAVWTGAIDGKVFKRGAFGVGYYDDGPIAACGEAIVGQRVGTALSFGAVSISMRPCQQDCDCARCIPRHADARRARFAEEAALPPPPLPTHRITVAGGNVNKTDVVEKTLAFAIRQLDGADKLTRPRDLLNAGLLKALSALPSRFPAACMGSPLAVHLSRWLWLSCSPPMLSSHASPPPIALPLSLLAYAPARLLDCKSVRLTLRLTLLGLPWSAYPCVCSPKASQCLCVSACVSKHSSTCACNTHVHWHMFYVPHADAALEACCLSISITMSWLGLTLALLSWPHTRHSSFALPLLLPSTPLPIIN